MPIGACFGAIPAIRSASPPKTKGAIACASERSTVRVLSARLRGRVQFEADVLPYLQWERLANGKATLVPTHGIVAGVRAVHANHVGARAGAADRRGNPHQALDAAQVERGRLADERGPIKRGD